MSVRIRTITIDCADPYALSHFWSKVTGFTEDPDDPNLPEHTEDVLLGRDGSPNLLFMQVPEGKQVKNRVHLDMVPADPSPGTRDAEVERIMALGATLVADQRRPDRTGWVVLADPEGNEFCIERGIPGG